MRANDIGEIQAELETMAKRVQPAIDNMELPLDARRDFASFQQRVNNAVDELQQGKWNLVNALEASAKERYAT